MSEGCKILYRNLRQILRLNPWFGMAWTKNGSADSDTVVFVFACNEVIEKALEVTANAVKDGEQNLRTNLRDIDAIRRQRNSLTWSIDDHQAELDATLKKNGFGETCFCKKHSTPHTRVESCS